MAILRHILTLSLASLLAGCYENFDPKVDTAPVLCINSLITAGEPMEVHVTHTWMFSDQNAELDHAVDDATVTIYANGTPVPADYLPREGDEIRIVAESRRYGRAEAAVTVPKPVPFSAVSFVPEVLSVWNDPKRPMAGGVDFSLVVRATIADRHKADDYFQLACDWKPPVSYDVVDSDYDASHEPYAFLSPGTFDFDAEPIFKEHIGVFESVMGNDDVDRMIFTDHLFAGREYTLNLHFNNATYSVNSPEFNPELYDCCITLTLASVSRSYYDRAIYVWQRDTGILGDLGDLGFAEPIWGYSNVSTSAGTVAARSLTTYTLSLNDFLKKILNQQ